MISITSPALPLSRVCRKRLLANGFRTYEYLYGEGSAGCVLEGS